MRSQYLAEGTIEVSGSSGAARFHRIWAGIGRPETDQGHLLVVGDRTDGRYHALSETRGGLWELASAAVEAQKAFFIERIMVDATDELCASYLRNYEGLCLESDSPDQASYLPIGSMSGAVKTRRSRPAPIISSVHERFVLHYRAALEQTRGVVMSGRLLVHEANCPILAYTLRQPLKDILPSSAMKALVWTITALEQSRDDDGSYPVDRESWYANVGRLG
jgi:hypothetical protein